jgi:DNA-binding beta-propeller fold protein YncE
MNGMPKLVLLVALAGCLPDTDGIDPPLDQLIFPVGLAVTADDSRLLAVNSNFDLEYNSGTLTAIDISDLHAAIAEETAEVSPDGRYVFIDDSALIIESETIRVGAFASDLALSPGGERAMIPVRGERAILLIEVGDPAAGAFLDCGQGDDRRCDSAHRVESNDRFTLPIEPYEVAALDYVEPSSGGITTLGFATHLAGGEVSLFVVQDGAAGSQNDGELIGVLGGVIREASGIAVNPVNKQIYVAGRSQDAQVAVLSVYTDSTNGQYSHEPFFRQVSHIDIGAEMYAGTNARGLAVADDGAFAYLATRTPAALLELDAATHELTDMTTVCTDPSVVELFRHDGGTTDPADDVTYAFVLCFLTGQVFIVDTKALIVRAVRSVGSNPHAVAFDRTRRRAYVANFRESTISIIDVEPPLFDLARYRPGPGEWLHDENDPGRSYIVKIGKPRLPKGHS